MGVPTLGNKEMFIRDFVPILEGRLREELGFIQVVLGPRQVGKTTGLKMILENWEGECHYCSADLPAPPDNQWIIENWKKARLLGAGTLLVIDEVQKVDRWSEVVKALFDEDRAQRELMTISGRAGSEFLWGNSGGVGAAAFGIGVDRCCISAGIETELLQ